MTKVATVMMGILIVLITVILGLWAWSLATGRAASHEQILEHQERVESQLIHISCLLELGATPDPEEVAVCQVGP